MLQVVDHYATGAFGKRLEHCLGGASSGAGVPPGAARNAFGEQLCADDLGCARVAPAPDRNAEQPLVVARELPVELRDLLAAEESRERDQHRPRVGLGGLGVHALTLSRASHELCCVEGLRSLVRKAVQRGGQLERELPLELASRVWRDPLAEGLERRVSRPFGLRR